MLLIFLIMITIYCFILLVIHIYFNYLTDLYEVNYFFVIKYLFLDRKLLNEVIILNCCSRLINLQDFLELVDILKVVF
jgi:hypothetical protein